MTITFSATDETTFVLGYNSSTDYFFDILEPGQLLDTNYSQVINKATAEELVSAAADLGITLDIDDVTTLADEIVDDNE